MKKYYQTMVSVGFAMFAMFFGAGNIVFPLTLGVQSGTALVYAILGFLIMGVGIPFLGLFAVTLFEGNYWAFFSRLGRTPAFCIIAFIIAIIGPLVAMPRCVALTFSTMKAYLGPLANHVGIFNLLFCILLYFMAAKKHWVVPVLGYVLSPIKLSTLFILSIAGLLTVDQLVPTANTPWHAIQDGITMGYNTMDLLATFFFCSFVYASLQHQFGNEEKNRKAIMRASLGASVIGAGLLGIVYISFCIVAAYHAKDLQQVSAENMIYAVSLTILGKYATLFVAVCVSFACLATALALSSVSSHFLQEHIGKNRIGYHPALMLILTCTYFISVVGFNKIITAAAPVLQILYPGLIVLSVFNILHKLYRINMVKIPVYLTVLITAGVLFSH